MTYTVLSVCHLYLNDNVVAVRKMLQYSIIVLLIRSAQEDKRMFKVEAYCWYLEAIAKEDTMLDYNLP